MKKTIKLLALAVGLTAALNGCMADEPLYSEGEGTIYLSTRLNSDVQVKSRAELDDLAMSADIWIANDKGIVRKFDSFSDIPTDGIKLVAGSYKAMVWAGDSVPASWTARFFKGQTDFTLNGGDKRNIEIVGKIANSAVSVNFDNSVVDVLSGYSLTVGHSQGTLTFNENTEGKIGYFMMNSRDKSLTYTLKGTLNNGEEYVRTGTIDNCKPTTLYTLKVSCSETSGDAGGVYFTIEVDETMIDMPVDITIDAAPEIKGIGFDLSQPQRASEGNLGSRSIWITATSKITNFVLACDHFDTMFDFQGEDDFDFLNMTDEDLKNRIMDAGISYIYNENPQKDDSFLPTIKLAFDSKFTDSLKEGEYPINITVTDENGKSATACLNIIISDALLVTEDISENLGEIWATHATLSVTVQKEGLENVMLKYRKKGTQSWEGSVSPLSRAYEAGKTLTFELTDLTPGTTYEYCGATDDFTGNILEFTTESDAQLPNNSFESWFLYNDKVWIPGDDYQSNFWDSGNHGSTTLGKDYNITISETTLFHEGTTAISLNSKKVVTQFAAGNVFAGKYLDTKMSGLTGNGVLGWGRPFASRPKEMKVWARYTPQNISDVGSGAPNEYKKGEPDRGIIYIALLDSHTEEYKGEKFPVIIQTEAANRRLFDAYGSDKQHVIAYGEHIFDSESPATNSDNGQLVQITIKLDYDSFDYNIRPTYILLTASASKGGDYFTGGNGSVLVLDDIELVY